MSFEQVVALLLVIALAGTAAVSQQTATLTPSKDNTLYENATGSLSNGAGDGIFAGRNNGLFSPTIYRRGLLAFDVSSIPAGSVVTSAQLRLVLVASNASVSFGLHSVLADWGETGSVASVGGGGGGPAQPGDATWLHTFSPGSTWTNPGGDFAATPGATQQISGSPGTNIVWTSTPQLVSNVQAWVDTPASNFGWLLKGPETGMTTAAKFSSREGFYPPELTVTYTPPAASVTVTGTGCAVGLGGSPFTLGANGLPSLGNTSFGVTLANGHASRQGFLFLASALAPAPIPFPQTSCDLYLDPLGLQALIVAGVSPIGPLPLDASGGAMLPVPISVNPALAGFTIHVQAASVLGMDFATSNALTLVLN